MKANTKVCVKIDGKWKKGTVIADNNETIRVGVGEPYRRNYSEGDFNRTSVKRFIQIDEKDAEIFHKHQFDNLHDMIFELKNKYFPNEKIEINDMNVIIDNLSVGPCIMEVETIGAIMEVAGWSLDASVYRYYVNGVPDMDVVDLGKWRDSTEAATAMMRNLFDADMKQYLEKKSEEAFAISVLNNSL